MDTFNGYYKDVGKAILYPNLSYFNKALTIFARWTLQYGLHTIDVKRCSYQGPIQ